MAHIEFLPSKGNRAPPVLVILIHPNADYAGKNGLLSIVLQVILGEILLRVFLRKGIFLQKSNIIKIALFYVRNKDVQQQLLVYNEYLFGRLL